MTAKTTTSSFFLDPGFRTFTSEDGVRWIQAVSQAGRTLKRGRTADSLPNYKQLIKTGRSATTSLDAYEETEVRRLVQPTLSKLNKTYYRTTNYGFNPKMPFPVFPPGLRVEAEAAALKRFNRAVQERQSPFQAQIFLGEIRETLKFLRNPLSQTIDTLNSFERLLKASKKVASSGRPKDRRAIRETKALVKDLADQWLELRFAILPLMNDINSVIDIALFGTSDAIRESFSDFRASSSSAVTGYSVGGVTYQIETITSFRCDRYIKVGILFEDVTSAVDLQSYLKRSLTNFSDAIPTAWELTPYSFLVDYFVNIGDIIQSVANSAKISVNWSSATTVQTTTLSQKVKAVTNGHQYIIKPYTDAPEFILRRREVSRRELASTIPPVVFNIPHSDIKLANMSALLLSKLIKE